ncbi:MAG TPA: hypothetical protein VFR32_03275 [Gaiellaceae bacterium]|nr:hypothetical protein [Gaiellaceae bacterium]
MSERYLEELDRALRARGVPARRRRRFLEEAADHLACDPDGVARFGDPEPLARQVASAEQPRRVRRLSLLLGCVTVAFVAPLYAIPENALPPAPPEGLPSTVQWKLDAAVILFAAALVFALVTIAASWARPRLAGWPAWMAVGSLAASAGVGSAAAAEWPVGGSTALASVIPAAATLVCLAAFATTRLASAAWPRRST